MRVFSDSLSGFIIRGPLILFSDDFMEMILRGFLRDDSLRTIRMIGDDSPRLFLRDDSPPTAETQSENIAHPADVCLRQPNGTFSDFPAGLQNHCSQSESLI